MIRHDWSLCELEELNSLPLFELMSRAHLIHRAWHPLGEIQVCTLISVKTGGCPENCKYCSQSSRYQTPTSAQPMMSYEEVMQVAEQAISRGSTRVCLGAAWREVRDSKQFDEVIRMIQGITALGVEVCCTLGMLNEAQARRLKEAGLYAYNHNLDTSEEYYKTVVTSRTYQDRLATLDIVDQANISVCCGGIIGMGETQLDRIKLLHTLALRSPHPESVPINRLSPIPGTPFGTLPPLSIWEMIRMVALTRIVIPQAMVRLSAGRLEMSMEDQTLCFFAGANSIFAGDKLLTIANTPASKDDAMFATLGLKKRPAFKCNFSKN